VLRDPALLTLGVLQAATFGLAIVAGNWAVPLLERQGASSAAAGLAAGLILFAGILTRPTGGMLARPAWRRNVCALALVGVAAGNALLALGVSFAVAAAGALLVGLAAGLPFAIIFAAVQQARPDAPASAIALANGVALATILVGTPLAGLAFELPGDGRLAFVAIAGLSATALLALPRARL
jgi:predicted MFS family arabinose efflux permease